MNLEKLIQEGRNLKAQQLRIIRRQIQKIRDLYNDRGEKYQNFGATVYWGKALKNWKAMTDRGCISYISVRENLGISKSEHIALIEQYDAKQKETPCTTA